MGHISLLGKILNLYNFNDINKEYLGVAFRVLLKCNEIMYTK